MVQPRILFVAMPDSIHVARWIDLIADVGWDLHLFPVYKYPPPPHPDLRNVTVHYPRMSFPARVASVFREPRRTLGKILDRWRRPRRRWPSGSEETAKFRLEEFVAGLREIGIEAKDDAEAAPEVEAVYGPGVLASLIRRLRPRLVHSMELQHAGYLTLRAKALCPGFPVWMATNWGSDIFYYRQFGRHRRAIERLLRTIDWYSCECRRDVELARELGYSGPVFPVLPNSGGFRLEHVRALRSSDPPSKRRVILVKGYQHFAGRALTALAALERVAPLLRGYRTLVYKADTEVVRGMVGQLAARGLDISAIRQVTHDDMLRLFGSARLCVAISASDAISTAVLECMAMGAFPIQSDTSCCDEWIKDGEGGFIVPPENVDLIAERLRRALSDDSLVDRAAELNWSTVVARLDASLLRERVIEGYSRILERR